MRQTVNLPDNLVVRLWLSGNEQDYRSRPVVELVRDGVPVQWWISPQGDGWNGSLTCVATDLEPNCILVDSLGMHASVAEMVLLRDGRLVHPAHAEAISNSAGMLAADLDGNGYLDVIGTVNDYRPNYAQGHNYWQTFRFAGDEFAMTGCALQRKGEPAPTHLLTGGCPTA